MLASGIALILDASGEPGPAGGLDAAEHAAMHAKIEDPKTRCCALLIIDSFPRSFRKPHDLPVVVICPINARGIDGNSAR